jgi:Protein of unknown function (DUF4019)
LADCRRFCVTCVIALLVALGAAGGVALAGPEDAAQAAGESWLRLVDGGDYAGSWSQAAPVLKSAVQQADWAEMVRGARAPLGQLASRKLKSREYTEKAPTTTRVVGGKVYTWSGPGKYVVIQYDAAFAEKASAVETVIVMMGPDGGWRVSGYSVR